MNKKAKCAIAAALTATAVGAVFITKKYGAFKKESRCKECGKKLSKELFTIYEPEDMGYLSKDVVENRYLESGAVCPYCYESIYAPNIEEYEKALDTSIGVKVYFKDFKGDIDYKDEIKKVKTDFFDSKEECIQSIKTIASYTNCDIVFDLEVLPETINSGGTKSTVYKASGILAKSY